ncbi:chalcone isomerase family protein [Enterovibrio calviensis]|uniref:hypothetical protein n=1 Tax=Enterovibrio calviensis TaxID=91359 RepID=UPI00048822AC|nr:hypothetical protein [Enterovibrio calviensis]
MVAFKHGNNQKIAFSFLSSANLKYTLFGALAAMSFSVNALMTPQPSVNSPTNAVVSTAISPMTAEATEASEATQAVTKGTDPASSSVASLEDWVWWKTVGSATLTWGFWKVYDSELRTPSGKFADDDALPLALVITYSRDIDADDLLDATVEQWEHLGFSATQIDEWLPKMKGAWPDVKEGDRLIYVLSDKGGQFVYQPLQGKLQPFATLEDMSLARAFSDIWLSPKTAYPSLRLALIGRN